MRFQSLPHLIDKIACGIGKNESNNYIYIFTLWSDLSFVYSSFVQLHEAMISVNAYEHSTLMSMTCLLKDTRKLKTINQRWLLTYAGLRGEFCFGKIVN